MYHCVRKVEKVCQNWSGKLEIGSFSDFDIALNTDGGSGIIVRNTEGVEIFCPKCGKRLKSEITTKPQKSSKKFSHAALSITPKLADYASQNADQFFDTIGQLTKKRRLKISVCCLLLTADKQSEGDNVACITWSNKVPNINLTNRQKYASLIGIESENRNLRKRKFRYKCVGCPKNENCANWLDEGTSSFNEFGKVLSNLENGFNVVAFDLDHDLENLIGFQTWCNDFIVFLKQSGRNHFWVTFSLPVYEGTKESYHTVVCQIVLARQTHALIVDPNENVSFVDNKRGQWLSQAQPGKKPAKTEIKHVLKKLFDVKNFTFGTNGNGRASPTECFAQYDNACNVTVIVTLFWAAVGYEKVPRFDKVAERAIFCRLRKLAATKNALPENLSRPVHKTVLRRAVKSFISE